MTQADYARRRGVSKQYIGKLVTEGIVVLNDDQTVNVEASDANIEGRVQTVAGKVPKTLGEARYVDMMLRIRERQLDLSIKEGNLVPLDRLKLLWSELGSEIQNSIMQVPDRLAVQLSRETDARKIRLMLAEELSRQLKVLSKSPVPSLAN